MGPAAARLRGRWGGGHDPPCPLGEGAARHRLSPSWVAAAGPRVHRERQPQGSGVVPVPGIVFSRGSCSPPRSAARSRRPGSGLPRGTRGNGRFAAPRGGLAGREWRSPWLPLAAGPGAWSGCVGKAGAGSPPCPVPREGEHAWRGGGRRRPVESRSRAQGGGFRAAAPAAAPPPLARPVPGVPALRGICAQCPGRCAALVRREAGGGGQRSLRALPGPRPAASWGDFR